MASALHWIPDSLYNYAIAAVVANYASYQRELRTFHENVLFDVYYKLYKEGRLCWLSTEFCNLEVFEKLLKVKDKRYLLHHCFQALMDHGSRSSLQLAVVYRTHCSSVKSSSDCARREKAIQSGLQLASFLSDAGWFQDSEKVLTRCLELCTASESPRSLVQSLECCWRLLHVRNAFCKFEEAEETFVLAQTLIDQIKSSGQRINFSGIYAEFSTLFFSRSNYKEAYKWSTEALKTLSSHLSPKVLVDVLRQSAKACVVKREFKQAGMLIKQALTLAWEYFGTRHPVTADTLLDYGFYLLNVDSIRQSIEVYQNALETRQYIFGGQNLLVAIAHEDLAYATYVHEYSSGRFKDAKEHAEKAMEIMHNLLPYEHLLLASSKRVKALILEEIAIDNHDKAVEKRLLSEAEELHMSALQLARKAFGEMNVQTAKHYGNLGRLYQSMRRFQEAEKMHLKAISIKERILGSDDYEVALSVGHLASLYNYDMMLFQKAETLYLQSIDIGIKLFGEGYSGLEYDYRGLLRVYTTLSDHAKAAKYHSILHHWKQLRDRTAEAESETSPLMIDVKPIPVEQIYDHFLTIV